MSEVVNGNGGRIKFKDVIWLCTISVSISLGALWIHSETPHRDAVTKREIDKFETGINSKFADINEKLNKVEDKLDTLILRFPKDT